jgi:hypothetical protein
MREKLGVLGATVEAGFEGLRGKTEKTPTTKPTEVVAPLRSDVVATPDQVSLVNEELKSVLGENFDGEGEIVFMVNEELRFVNPELWLKRK